MNKMMFVTFSLLSKTEQNKPLCVCVSQNAWWLNMGRLLLGIGYSIICYVVISAMNPTINTQNSKY